MNENAVDAKRCPLCGQENRCGMAVGKADEACWCKAIAFPQQIFELVPPEKRNKACICRSCLDRFKDGE